MAKGRKQPMYTPKQRMFYERCSCDPKGMQLSDDFIEEIEMAKLSGGFSMNRSNVCPVCFEAKPLNGKCHCND